MAGGAGAFMALSESEKARESTICAQRLCASALPVMVTVRFAPLAEPPAGASIDSFAPLVDSSS